MKNMVAFAPCFSIFRHDEWGIVFLSPARPPCSVLSGGLRMLGFRHDESGRACNMSSDNTKRLTTSNENAKSAFVFLQRNIGNPTS